MTFCESASCLLVQRSEKGGRSGAAQGPVRAGWTARISEGGEGGNDLMKCSEPRVEVRGARSAGKVDGEEHRRAERRAGDIPQGGASTCAGHCGVGHALALNRRRAQGQLIGSSAHGAPGDSSRNRRVEVAGECGYQGHLDPLAIWAPKNLRLISCDLVSSPLSLGLLTCKRRTKMPAPRRVGESFPGVGISPRAFPFSSNLSSLL